MTAQRSHKEVFDDIYRRNRWLVGSGPGSVIEQNRPYVAFLQGFLARNAVRSVVDAGCGDWQLARHVDWTGVAYVGVDVSKVALALAAKVAPSGTVFLCADARKGLQGADLLIMKDVMQHWPIADIAGFLPQLAKFRFCLLTNDFGVPGIRNNADIEAGGWRGLDLTAPPFKLRGQYVGRAQCGGFEKRVLLVRHEDVRAAA